MRSRKYAALLLSMSMAASVAACSSDGEAAGTTAAGNNNAETKVEQSSDDNASGGQLQQSDSKLGFKTAGKELKIGMDFSEVSDALGEPVSYFEAESCAFQGMDKVYTYADFVIRTFPDGDVEKICSIELKDDIVTTPEGVYIGMTADDVKSAYSSYTISGDENSSMTIVDGGTKLFFVFKDGTVDSITYIVAE
ncbi:MAG: hypothetical protein K6G47_11455 [Clostridia bacterium]|nr:hypothetical protein [Clostridia bacterium]